MYTQDMIDLQRGRWFSALPEALRDEVLRSTTRQKLKRGKHILRQGDPANGLYGLVGGEAQIIGTTLAGLDILVAVYRPGDWTGFLACVDEGPYTFSVVASQPCEVVHLPLAAVNRIFLSDAEGFRRFILPELASTRAIYSQIIESLAYTPLQRLARRLVDLTSEPHGDLVTSSFISPVTQDQIALSIMASRQWTNRLLQHLEQAEVIRISRSRIDILDRTRLTQLAVHGESGFTLAEGTPAKVTIS
ncbi:MAG: hypothetical protein CVT79_00235 [Alphaproteobacteria bacterium HGW-Alphaproteobacteria-18]|nr:MAG: hypothetical protein CVT79_00235 [Alphaproteobacteria bacterium HGW-Alphaproteobacteria-18]